MKLIDNFVEKFHNYSLPKPEKCFVLEVGDELYINKWIKNGKINGKMKDIFEWIEKKYLSKNLILKLVFLSKIKNAIFQNLSKVILLSFDSDLMPKSVNS